MKIPPHSVRVVVGAVAWVLLFFLAYRQILDPVEGRGSRAMDGLASYLFQRQVPVVIQFEEPVEIAVGDPIYSRGPGDSLTLAGEVRALLSTPTSSSPSSSPVGSRLELRQSVVGDGVFQVECNVRAGSERGTRLDRARLVSIPQTASWVLRTLLPPAKLERIAHEWNQALLLHREEIFSVMRPVFQAFLHDLEEVLREDLPPILKRRQAQLGAIGRRLEDEILRKEFSPILRTELWPLIEARLKPTLDEISDEVWTRLPVWSFAWRYLYQSLPLTSDSHLKKQVDRFWNEETVPILKSHAEDFLGIVLDIVRESAANPRVSEAFENGLDLILADRELQHQLRLVFQEVFLDNPNFHRRMAALWQSPELVSAVNVLSHRLEPTIRRIGDIILGTRGGGITPEFARVLRTQILEKDRRFLVLEWTTSRVPARSPSISPLQPGMVIPAVVEKDRS